jgi:drug/metabolite transporter (DMT)-like permease
MAQKTVGAVVETASSKTDVWAHLALFWMVVCFAGYTVVGKELEDASAPLFKPLLFILLRHWIAAAVLLLLTTLREGVRLPHRDDLGLIIATGLVGITYAQITFIYGVWFTSATYAAMLEPLCPVFACAIALVFGLERFTRRRTAGIALAVAGATLTTWWREPGAALKMSSVLAAAVVGKGMGRLATLMGTTVLLNAVLGQAVFVVLIQRVHRTRRYDSAMWLTTWFVVIGALGTTTVALVSLLLSPGLEWPGADKFRASPAFWAEVLYAALVATVQNYSIRSWAVTRLGPTSTAMYQTINPPCTALLAFAFLGEAPNAMQVAGTAVIVVGHLVSEMGEDPERGGDASSSRGKAGLRDRAKHRSSIWGRAKKDDDYAPSSGYADDVVRFFGGGDDDEDPALRAALLNDCEDESSDEDAGLCAPDAIVVRGGLHRAAVGSDSSDTDDGTATGIEGGGGAAAAASIAALAWRHRNTVAGRESVGSRSVVEVPMRESPKTSSRRRRMGADDPGRGADGNARGVSGPGLDQNRARTPALRDQGRGSAQAAAATAAENLVAASSPAFL